MCRKGALRARADEYKQGFDEFMNLVIDDAVEVKLATKSEPEESRRRLGKHAQHLHAQLVSN